jgi:hypothetical protein
MQHEDRFLLPHLYVAPIRIMHPVSVILVTFFYNAMSVFDTPMYIYVCHVPVQPSQLQVQDGGGAQFSQLSLADYVNIGRMKHSSILNTNYHHSGIDQAFSLAKDK